MIAANDPTRTSWVSLPKNTDFPIQNLPFGVFRRASDAQPRLATRIGALVVDLKALADAGLLGEDAVATYGLDAPNLNALAAKGRAVSRTLRNRLSELLASGNTELGGNVTLQGIAMWPVTDVEMLMPFDVRDYTDFYSSIDHATNVGTMFRDPNNALLPNWKHIPVGYHGRASSIVVSGTPLHRPKGQQLPKDATQPVYGPSKLLDFELEMAFAIGQGNALGQPIPVANAEDHIFGMMLFNDWSARDIQKWEYVPLGPFLGKNFGSSVSPWVVTMDALEPFRTGGYDQDPKPLPYLQSAGDANFDIQLEVFIQPDGQDPHRVCKSNFKYMYWTMRQQLAHHTVNGCNMRAGDLCASGTISGPTPDTYGSMLELAWRGTKPIPMPDGSERKFIADGDTVIMRGYCEKASYPRIGFGEVSTKIVPAI